MERHHKRIISAKRRKLIAAYKLPGSPGVNSSLPVDTADDSNAAVVNNGVISFVEGMSALNREYIRKSYLLASSYVSDVLKVHRGTEAWYDEFIKVMISLGWLPLRSSFERVASSGRGLTVQLAALNMIAAMLASTSLASPLLAALPKLAADALVFLDAMKELTATLLLSPTGLNTLATAVWAHTSNVEFAAAAPYAALLILVSGLPVYLLTTRMYLSR